MHGENLLPLSEDELQLLEMYRRMTPDDRQQALILFGQMTTVEDNDKPSLKKFFVNYGRIGCVGQVVNMHFGRED